MTSRSSRQQYRHTLQQLAAVLSRPAAAGSSDVTHRSSWQQYRHAPQQQAAVTSRPAAAGISDVTHRSSRQQYRHVSAGSRTTCIAAANPGRSRSEQQPEDGSKSSSRLPEDRPKCSSGQLKCSSCKRKAPERSSRQRAFPVAAVARGQPQSAADARG